MSKARLSRVASTGTIFKDCLHPQHYYLSLELEDPDGKILCRMAMSYDQFVQLLVDSSNVTVTLERYRSTTGDLVEEKIEPPQSTHDRMLDRMGETLSSLMKRLEDTRKDVYEMVNGEKPNKKRLTQLLQDIEIINSHLQSNTSFVVTQASEELNSLTENAKSQLSLFLTSKGVDTSKLDLTPMLELPSVKALPNYTEPVQENYSLKEREQKTLNDMTVMEVADEINKILHNLEALQTKQKSKLQTKNDETIKLFMANATHSQNSVHVRYISYQGTTRFNIDDAKKYLKFLRTVKNINDFKTHYWFERSSL